MKLTDAVVAKVKATDKRQEIPDTLCPSLYLVVQPSGHKGWQVRYRTAGVHRRMTLGVYPLIGLKDARTRAREALLTAQDGGDPATTARAKKAKRQDINDRDKIKSLVEQFDKRHLSKLKSRKNAKQFLDRFVVAEWGNRDVHDISKRDVIDLLDKIYDSGLETTANRVLAHARKFFNWCVERDVIEFAPTTNVKPPAQEKPCERFLNDYEIGLFWRACESVGEPWGRLGQTLLLTAQRLNEVAQMTDREVVDGIWHLAPERTKNGLAHDVPISTAASDVLASVQRIDGQAGLIFTTNGETPVQAFHKARGGIAKAMEVLAVGDRGVAIEIPHWTFHDLRRTAETGMSRLRISQEIIDKVTNHISGQHRMARVYNQNDYMDEKRSALETWGRFVTDLVEGDLGNVVQISEAAR